MEAKGFFLEKMTNYDDAFEWYAKIEERYDDSTPLIGFCERSKILTGDSRFEPELKKRLGKLFPSSMEKFSWRTSTALRPMASPSSNRTIW